MIFKNKHNNKADLHFKIEIDNKHIEKVDVTKFLGILIDNNLSWKAHTNHITKIVSKLTFYEATSRKMSLSTSIDWPFLSSVVYYMQSSFVTVAMLSCFVLI